MKKSYPFVLGLIAIVLGVTGLYFLQIYSFALRSPSFKVSRDTFPSVGERIYFTAIGKDGPISLRGGPYWLRMHGGGCASCHGADGQGSLPIMMSDEEAPAISYKALTQEEHKEEGKEEHPPYNEKLIKRAITEGTGPDGKPLDLTMPRWKMSDEDLNQLIDFLKTLD